ncbi:MAG: type IV pilin N-terminal domain-containing protein, partial [Thermoplasmata archaeon]|nr:type IV pilin N-terminal domain-containing protein [Thermoplasmata archaeon]
MDANIKFKKAWSDKGVSEVIGTILMLAITVVLFSTIMLAVMNIPTPSQRPSADFSATLKFTTPTDAYLNITHMGGETLFNYSTSIFILKGETTTAYYLADGGIPLTWSISQVWSIKLSSLTTSTRLEVRIIDLDSSSTVWTSMVSSGQTSSYPIILQRWVDANISTLTLDPIRSSDTKGFTFYVRVIDSDYDLNSTGVWVDASPVGGSSHKVRSAASGGVWEFVFDPASDPTSYDKKPLFIHAIDELGHESIESYVLSVQQPDITINEGDQNTYTNPPVGEEGLPSYMVYVHGDQGYVVLGEMNNTNVSREWGVEANTSDPKFIFTQGQEWVFIRVGSKILKNVDAKNMFSVRSLFSNEEIVPPSNSSGFSLLTVAGPAYIYQAKFNSSLLAPGAYNVFIDLLSSSVEGQAPARFMADFVLTILAQPGQEPIFVPTVTFWDKDRRIDGTAQQWGNKTTPYDLSDVSMSKVWVEIKMQTVGAAASASVYEVRILDMRGRTNLYGDPPTGDGMISAIGSDGTHVCYYFSVDLRLRNGVSYSAGMGAYTMRIVKIFDDNEGIYSISQPIWIRSAVSTKNFVVASSGFGLGDSSSNFMHIDYLFQIDNNKFFTTRVLEAA